MRYRTGILTYTDTRQVQNTIETEDFNAFFNERGVILTGRVRDTLSNIFVNGSMNRSLFFMDYNIRDFGSRTAKNSWLPAFGVKGGSPGLTRKTNYAEIHLCSEEELAGKDFNEFVFGTDYLSGEETVTLSADRLLNQLWRVGSLPSCTIPERNRKKVCRVLEKLWETQERNPRTRFIIKMDDAEKKSVDLLQQLYLLLPQNLRLQLGFETNIDSADLNQIQEYQGIPIYILTAESKQIINTEIYGFPIEIYDMTEADQYIYNEERLQLIEKLACRIDERMLSNLDYSERKVLEENNIGTSSFEYYQEIVSSLFTGTLFWWNRESIDSIDTLEHLYMDQKDLMRNPDYHKEALIAFSTIIYPNSDLSRQTVDLFLQKKSDKRTRQLEFLGSQMNLKNTIDGLTYMFDQIDEKRRISEENLKNKLEKEAAANLKAQENQLTSQIEQKNYLIGRLKENAQQLEQKNRALEETNRNLEAELNKSKADQSIDSRDRKSGSKASKETKKMAKQLLIFKVLTGIAMIGAVVFLAFFIWNTMRLAQAKQEYKQLEIQQLASDDENRKLKQEIDELEKEKNALEEKLQKKTISDESIESAEVSVDYSETEEIAPPQETEEADLEQYDNYNDENEEGYYDGQSDYEE